jgi:putative ATPase
MDDLFSEVEKAEDLARQSLAARMRPLALEEVVGQAHLLGEGKLLRRLIDSDRLNAAIFFGPPGTGKTTLAYLIAKKTKAQFHALNAVEASVQHVREVIEIAEKIWRNQKRRTLLLIDEIHRFNRAQQDVLLPHVERGTLRLIGATTYNPFFYLNSALISRGQVFEFKSLTESEIILLMKRALENTERGLGAYQTEVEEDAFQFWAKVCDGDARQALNALELAVITTAKDEKSGIICITREIAEESIQKRSVVYDAKGDGHYDTISAFIKAVRASEPDTAIYWLGKMLIAGEDPRFIARRLILSASEDIGMADPQALPLAVACQQAVEFTGMPEARIPLAETTVYLSTAPKSNASYMALETAMAEIKSGRLQPVPEAVRGTGYSGAKKMGRGKGYEYAHDYAEGIAPSWTLNVPEFYKPTQRGYEKIVAERLAHWAELRKKKISQT